MSEALTAGRGSTIVDAKAAMLRRLGKRPGMDGVYANYDPPKQGSDIKTDDGAIEAVWLDNGPGGDDIHVEILKSLPLEFDETYDFALVIQVLRPSSEATLEGTEARSFELLHEVIGELASDPTLGIDPDSYLRFEVLPLRWTHNSGLLPKPPGFGSRIELVLQGNARLALT